MGIKPKKPYKPRLAGKISNVVASDPKEALILAYAGQELDLLERIIKSHFDNYGELQSVEAGMKKFYVQEVLEEFQGKWSEAEVNAEKEKARALVEMCEKSLAGVFISCLRERDSLNG